MRIQTKILPDGLSKLLKLYVPYEVEYLDAEEAKELIEVLQNFVNLNPETNDQLLTEMLK